MLNDTYKSPPIVPDCAQSMEHVWRIRATVTKTGSVLIAPFQPFHCNVHFPADHHPAQVTVAKASYFRQLTIFQNALTLFADIAKIVLTNQNALIQPSLSCVLIVKDHSTALVLCVTLLSPSAESTARSALLTLVAASTPSLIAKISVRMRSVLPPLSVAPPALPSSTQLAVAASTQLSTVLTSVLCKPVPMRLLPAHFNNEFERHMLVAASTPRLIVRTNAQALFVQNLHFQLISVAAKVFAGLALCLVVALTAKSTAWSGMTAPKLMNDMH
jgi:hypothetical protein